MEHYYKIENYDHIVLHLLFDLLIGIMLFLFAFSCLKVEALGISSYNVGGHNEVISNLDLEVTHDVTGSPWSNWRYGYLYFDFSVNKVNGSATSSLVFPRSATACSGTTCYICSIGSTSTNNSTYDVSTFSAKCPMDIGELGLTKVSVQFNDFQSNNNSDYRFRMGGLMTFEQIAETSIDISSINQQTQQQIQNDNTNTQNIINNNNANTGLITGAINEQIESQQVCDLIDKNLVELDNQYLNANGISSDNNSFIITKYLRISSNDVLKVLTIPDSQGARYLCFYNTNKSIISCTNNTSLSVGATITIPPNTSYVRFSISKNINKPTFNLCRNGNQVIADNQKEIQDSLTNHDISDIDLDFFDEINQGTDTPITDLLTMPLIYLNKLIDTLDGTSCTPYTIPFDFSGGNNTLTFPCLNLQNYLGSTLWSAIDLIICGFMVYNIGMMVVQFYENWSSLQDTFDDLYVPKHTYHPKHAKE